MIWAVYLAYVDDHFEPTVAKAHTAAVAEFMQDKRGFPRFGAFVAELQALRDGSDGPISQLYPALLRWAATEGGKD